MFKDVLEEYKVNESHKKHEKEWRHLLAETTLFFPDIDMTDWAVGIDDDSNFEIYNGAEN